MWKGTGRSGIGDQTIIGEYDDWNGLSMNGRQWKSRLTQETRDLSGADYWHQRKALEPKTLEDIPTYVNGKPNIQAFSESVRSKPKTKPKKSAFQTVTLADSHYERLANLSEELDKELESGKLSFDDWSYARKTLDVRLEKAWHRLSLARGWTSHASDDPIQPLDFTLNAEAPRPTVIDYTVIPSDSVFAELQDGNSFKIIYSQVLTVCKWFVKFTSTAKQLVQEGLV